MLKRILCLISVGLFSVGTLAAGNLTLNKKRRRPASDTRFATAEGNTSIEKKMGAGGIFLEVSTFKDVTLAFGKAKKFQKGDAAGSETYQCYLSKDGVQALYLTSSEMGGGTTVDGITLKVATIFSIKECVKTEMQFVFGNGLKIFSSGEDMLKNLGEPTTRGLMSANYEIKKNIVKDDLTWEQNFSARVLLNPRDQIEEIMIFQATVN